MAKFRLVALDLDGTLLNSALKLSEGNAEALREALDDGVQVVLATSRWYGLALRTAVRLGIETPLICSNGAIVRRPSDGSELLHLYLEEEIAREVVALADERAWETYTTIGEATYMRMRPGIIPEKLPAGLRVADRQAEHLSEGRPTSVLVFGEGALDEITSRFLALYGDRCRFSINRPANSPHYVVLTHPEAEKAKALELVCGEMGIAPEETLAMGDSESDLGMLSLAGLGVAMGNSPDAVKGGALHIAPSNDADGVAWALRKFVL